MLISMQIATYGVRYAFGGGHACEGVLLEGSGKKVVLLRSRGVCDWWFLLLKEEAWKKFALDHACSTEEIVKK